MQYKCSKRYGAFSQATGYEYGRTFMDYKGKL